MCVKQINHTIRTEIPELFIIHPVVRNFENFNNTHPVVTCKYLYINDFLLSLNYHLQNDDFTLGELLVSVVVAEIREKEG